MLLVAFFPGQPELDSGGCFIWGMRGVMSVIAGCMRLQCGCAVVPGGLYYKEHMAAPWAEHLALVQSGDVPPIGYNGLQPVAFMNVPRTPKRLFKAGLAKPKIIEFQQKHRFEEAAKARADPDYPTKERKFPKLKGTHDVVRARKEGVLRRAKLKFKPAGDWQDLLLYWAGQLHRRLGHGLFPGVLSELEMKHQGSAHNDVVKGRLSAQCGQCGKWFSSYRVHRLETCHIKVLG